MIFLFRMFHSRIFPIRMRGKKRAAESCWRSHEHIFCNMTLVSQMENCWRVSQFNVCGNTDRVVGESASDQRDYVLLKTLSAPLHQV